MRSAKSLYDSPFLKQKHYTKPCIWWIGLGLWWAASPFRTDSQEVFLLFILSTPRVLTIFPSCTNIFDLRLDPRSSQVHTNYWVNTHTTEKKHRLTTVTLRTKISNNKNKQPTKVIWGGGAYKVMNPVTVRRSVEGVIQGRNLRMCLI